MVRVKLFPTLEHCIETAAREEFRSSVSRYLDRGLGDRELERRIELLKAFLESADFGRLRSWSEAHMVKGKKVKFVICWRREEPHCQMVVLEGD